MGMSTFPTVALIARRWCWPIAGKQRDDTAGDPSSKAEVSVTITWANHGSADWAFRVGPSAGEPRSLIERIS